MAIGQGAVSVTPLALATMVATVANGGTLVTPHLSRATDAGDGRGWQLLQPPPMRSQLTLTPDHLQAVRDGLWLAVNGAGTSGRARIDGMDVSGKTGTSQVISKEGKAAAAGKGWTCATTAGSSSSRRRTIRRLPESSSSSTADTVESTSAPIAKHVLETFFAKKEGRPLPVPPAEGHYGTGGSDSAHR